MNFIWYKENHCNREVENRSLLRDRKFFSSTENNLAEMLQRGFNSSMDNCQIGLIYGIVMGYILNNRFLISALTYSIRVSRGREACIFSKSILADSKVHPSLTSTRSFWGLFPVTFYLKAIKLVGCQWSLWLKPSVYTYYHSYSRIWKLLYERDNTCPRSHG